MKMCGFDPNHKPHKLIILAIRIDLTPRNIPAYLEPPRSYPQVQRTRSRGYTALFGLRNCEGLNQDFLSLRREEGVEHATQRSYNATASLTTLAPDHLELIITPLAF